MHSDIESYYKFTDQSRLNKSVNTLIGIVEGISIDSIINSKEVQYLNNWLNEHEDVKSHHPYNELVRELDCALSDGILTLDEKEDILWLCERLRSTEFYDHVTSDIQRLHAILGGIISDGTITKEELDGLIDWLESHDHLQRTWPYEEVFSLIVNVMSDQKIDKKEQESLKRFFLNFSIINSNNQLGDSDVTLDGNILGICAVSPKIEFIDQKFCITGVSAKYTRKDLSDIILENGGFVVSSVSSKTNYLIIGADGNPCWSYACYGRKVEKAIKLRKAGHQLMIIHENDFHDAILDY